MTARFRLSMAVLAASAALALAPGVSVAEYNGNYEPTQVPTSPPPVCGGGKALPYICEASKRSDEYRMTGICPGQQPNGGIGVVLCQDPWNTPIAGMECWDYGSDFDCEGAPWTPDQSLTYTWSGTGALRIFQPNGNRDPSVNISCMRLTGGGWLTLIVRTNSGISSYVTEYVSCLD